MVFTLLSSQLEPNNCFFVGFLETVIKVFLLATPYVLPNTWWVVISKNISLTTTTHVLLNALGAVVSKIFLLTTTPLRIAQCIVGSS